MRAIKHFLFPAIVSAVLAGVAGCTSQNPAPPSGNAAAISDAVQSLVDTVTSGTGVTLTATEFVAKLCGTYQSKAGTTQEGIAKDLALEVAANDTKDTSNTDGTKVEAANETANALTFIQQVSACQAYPTS